MRAFVDRVVAGWLRRWTVARERVPGLDHVWRAQQRYGDTYAGRLAAATAYYGFFAVFAMIMTVFVLLGQVFRNNSAVVEAVTGYLRSNLPQLQLKELIDSSGKIGLIAVVGFVIAGVAWVENLRSSQRALWRMEQQPGNPVVRWLVDLAVLLGLGLLLMVSVAVAAGVQDLLLRLAGEADQSPVRVVLRGSSYLQAGLVNVLLGAALLAGVPRLRMSPRRLLPPALLFAVGLGLLQSIGKWYIVRVERNPAYQVVAGTVGLLVFMYLLHQVLLFAAALAATSTRGTVVDLGRGRQSHDLVVSTAAAERATAALESAAAAAARAATAAERVVTDRRTNADPGVGPGIGADPRATGPRAGAESRAASAGTAERS